MRDTRADSNPRLLDLKDKNETTVHRFISHLFSNNNLWWHSTKDVFYSKWELVCIFLQFIPVSCYVSVVAAAARTNHPTIAATEHTTSYFSLAIKTPWPQQQPFGALQACPMSR
jgi:hypothetical protein